MDGSKPQLKCGMALNGYQKHNREEGEKNMINYEELTFLNEIYKGLNLITVSGSNTVLLGKCIESMEQFLNIKQQELAQLNEMRAQASSSLPAEGEQEQNPIKEE